MASVIFSVPDDVNTAFDRTFAGQNKSAVLADLMRRVVGVLARYSPQRSIQLAVDTKQHVFDTLNHAVALQMDDALLIAADDRYRSRALPDQKIVSLRDWAFTG